MSESLIETAHLHRDAYRVLDSWSPEADDLRLLKTQYLQFLDDHPDAMQRSCAIGHLTASALVMNTSGDRVLLTLHPKVGRWLQLGGHCEPGDRTLQAAAAREAHEESGIEPAWISPRPIRLDRHPVPCSGIMSEHLDVQYLVRVPDDAREVISEESDDLRWFTLDGLPDIDPSVRALLAEALVTTR